MSDKSFEEPRLAINRIYTKGGDKGQTALVGGQRVAKSDGRIECYGTVDELNACVGLARVSTVQASMASDRLATLAVTLRRVQHELFNLGSVLATLPEDVGPRQARIVEADVTRLEEEIDAANEVLPALRSFVLPGGSRLDAELHLCRTVCRRAERLLVRLGETEQLPPYALEYLNRLSDAFFVWSRWVNHVVGAEEALWEPNAVASLSGHA